MIIFIIGTISLFLNLECTQVNIRINYELVYDMLLLLFIQALEDESFSTDIFRLHSNVSSHLSSISIISIPNVEHLDGPIPQHKMSS